MSKRHTHITTEEYPQAVTAFNMGGQKDARFAMARSNRITAAVLRKQNVAWLLDRYKEDNDNVVRADLTWLQRERAEKWRNMVYAELIRRRFAPEALAMSLPAANELADRRHDESEYDGEPEADDSNIAELDPDAGYYPPGVREAFREDTLTEAFPN